MLLGFDGSSAAKYVSINDQPRIVRPVLIYLNPNEFLYYLFIISLDRCDGIGNTVEDSFGRMCVPNKVEDVNLKVFNMIKGISESKSLLKHISYKSRCELDDGKCNSKQKWTNDKCQCEYKKNIGYVKKIMPGILVYVLASKYLKDCASQKVMLMI